MIRSGLNQTEKTKFQPASLNHLISRQLPQLTLFRKHISTNHRKIGFMQPLFQYFLSIIEIMISHRNHIIPHLIHQPDHRFPPLQSMIHIRITRKTIARINHNHFPSFCLFLLNQSSQQRKTSQLCMHIVSRNDHDLPRRSRLIFTTI